MAENTSPDDATASGKPAVAEPVPSVTFSKITFSDSSSISLEPDDVVVFVGPNNAGKSAALRDLEAYIGPQDPKTVIRSVQLHKIGSADM